MWTRFKNTAWAKKTSTMIEYYNGKVEKNPFEWMPSREKLCNQEQKEIARSQSVKGQSIPGVKTWMACDFGLAPMTELAEVGTKKWQISELKTFQQKYATKPDAWKLWKNWNTYKESAFENFGVLTYFVIQNNLPTPSETKYTGVAKDGRTLIQEGKVQLKKPGDGTVPWASLLGPIFKWAEEFNPKDPKTAPVKLIHYCNNLGARSVGHYQTDAHWAKHLFANENSYLGLPCKCGNPSFFKAAMNGGPQVSATCNHAAAFNDPNYHGFYNKIMIDEKPANGKLNKFMQGVDAKYLGDVTSHCIVEKPWFSKNFKANLSKRVQAFLKDERAGWRRRLIINDQFLD